MYSNSLYITSKIIGVGKNRSKKKGEGTECKEKVKRKNITQRVTEEKAKAMARKVSPTKHSKPIGHVH